jgi:hypothetical protein
MAGDKERTGDWTGDNWARGQSEAADQRAELDTDLGTTRTGDRLDVDATTTNADEDRWNKTQWVGDQGEGAPMPVDPDTMPEGENALSGDRHTSGGQHWGQGQSADRASDSGDRILEQ